MAEQQAQQVQGYEVDSDHWPVDDAECRFCGEWFGEDYDCECGANVG